MARAATAGELALYRTPGKWSKLRAAIFSPTVIFQAQINQTFSTFDGVLELTYDNPVGTLANVLEDMTVLIGTTAGAHDVGIVRLRSIDASKFYIGQTSDVEFVNNQHLTVIDDFGLWARHVLISDGVAYMDGGTAYSDQHANFDPVPILGGNRILKLTGASVSANFNAASSYVIDSTISAYAWSAPGSSASSGMTTATPTITWNSTGWKKVYLTLTAANGKTYFAVRYVFIWNDANPPPRVQISPDACRQDAEEGGWFFEITLLDDCDVDTIRDHALVILFGEDHYGDTQSNIGPVVGCENIYADGWIARETIDWNPEQGSVRFGVFGAHFWFSLIPSYPDGVELVARAPGAWTEIQGLTVRKGLYHFLRWRTTAMRIMDVFLPDDTKYTKEVSSLAQNLWEQIREMAFLQIFARAGVNAVGQLFIEVHPQLVPEADRDWPTVMTITEQDWDGKIAFDRATRNEVSQLNLSGVAVNENGKGSAYFAVATGHTYSHYGKPEIQENLLVASQADTIQKAGLYYGWRNNPFPDIPIPFKAPIRLIDCFPQQQCAITIAAADTVRGIEYAGNLIPKSISLVQDSETGRVHSEVTFEAETFEAPAVKETVPGSNEPIEPPLPPLPPLPPIPVIIPEVITPTEDGGPPKVLAHDMNKGLAYTENFHDDGADVNWGTVNAGLTQAQYQGINEILITPALEIYALRQGVTGSGEPPFIAYAPSIGSTFTILENQATIEAHFGYAALNYAVKGIGINRLAGQVMYSVGIGGTIPGQQGAKAFLGSGTTFADTGVDLDIGGDVFGRGNFSFGNGNWRFTLIVDGSAGLVNYLALSADGSSIIRNVQFGGFFDSSQYHVPLTTTDTVLMLKGDGLLRITQNGAVASDFTTVIGSGLSYDLFGHDFNHRFACDPTGTIMMGSWDSSGRRGRSSDEGATWVGIPNLPYGDRYAYDYAGSNEDGSRWIAARGIIRYSPDFGESWENKEGNYSLIGIPSIDIVRVIEY